MEFDVISPIKFFGFITNFIKRRDLDTSAKKVDMNKHSSFDVIYIYIYIQRLKNQSTIRDDV